jgi:hypothetical protein
VAQKKSVDTNIANILSVSKICYDQPKECPTKVSALKLAAIDESAFVLPPPPVASYRLYTSLEGLWTREASVGKMLSTYDTSPQTNRPMEDCGIRKCKYRPSSPWSGARGFVNVEQRWALETADHIPQDQIYLIPAKIEECPMPDSLSDYHCVDLYLEDGADR